MICSTCVHAGTYHSRLIIQQQNQPPNSEMARSTQGDRATEERQMNDKTSPRLIPISRRSSSSMQKEYSSNRSIVICDDKCTDKRILRTGGATAAEEGGDEDKSKDDENNNNLLQQ